MEPRGIRLNNPGLIERSTTKWEGLSADQPDKRFCSFIKPEYGIRAMAILLTTYKIKYDLCTVKDIIRRWAPPHENKTSVYARLVAKRMGVEVEDEIDVTQFDTMRSMVIAIIKQEVGKNPYPDAAIDRGLSMANIRPGPKPLEESRTIKGSQIATVGAATTAATSIGAAVDVVQQVGDAVDAAEPIISVGQMLLKWAPVAAVLVVVIGIGVVVWARIHDHSRGIR